MDGVQLQRCAAELYALADEARGEAARVGAVERVEWRSLAADRFRAVLRREALVGRRCADVLDDAARAVAAHARAIDGAPAGATR
ncbi:MAG TPA: hypothetical protein VI248_21270 [Kineosporiaceae bacterium]